MDKNAPNSPCKECLERGVHPPPLADIEHLQSHLSQRDSQIIVLNADIIKLNTLITSLEEQVTTWREKYERLYDSHKRVQKLNQNLEDKLLQMVDKMKDEKTQLTKDITTLSIRLAECKNSYNTLQKENERYKNDMNLAIQLLQCKPDNFVSQKLDNLPLDTQNRVSQYIMSKSKPAGASTSKSANESENVEASEYEFNISASLMTKILGESIQDTVTKHCDSCNCSKAQCEPFIYNQTHCTIGTQTLVSGDIQPINAFPREESNNSRHSSPGNAGNTIKDRFNYKMPRPVYVIPQPSKDNKNALPSEQEKGFRRSVIGNMPSAETSKFYEQIEANVPSDANQEVVQPKQNMENPGVKESIAHHNLCDRTKATTAKKINSNIAEGRDGLYVKELCPITDRINNESVDKVNFRKSSQGSMGAVSRTSSLEKSTSGANKSNTHVGPGPRFCSLRMQAGSKNILLDNAQPDVPPVLYKRQTKYNEDFKVLNDDFNQCIDIEQNMETPPVELETAQNQINVPSPIKKDSSVVESTLIDVLVDNNNKGLVAKPNENSLNPLLMNVSSAPLLPLKTHSFTNSNEDNNDSTPSSASDLTVADADEFLTKSNSDKTISDENSKENTVHLKADCNPPKVFNFDIYEQQSKSSTHFNRPVGVVDINAIENTKISKKSPPRSIGSIKPGNETRDPGPSVVNVYPNLTQTHLKVTAGKRKFAEKRISSASSDDSDAFLKLQQTRVAEWVDQNRDQPVTNLEESMQSVFVRVPHPVSKYSKPLQNGNETAEGNSSRSSRNANGRCANSQECTCTFCQGLVDPQRPRQFSSEQLARMDHNVKMFFGRTNGDGSERNDDQYRRTSSKTETDV